MLCHQMFAKKKVNKVSESLKGFMNATEWSEYQQSMLPYVNTALYYSFTYCTYLNKDIEKMFYQDFTQFGTLYFDNRLCTTDLFNRRQIHSLNSQREMEQEGPYVKKR